MLLILFCLHYIVHIIKILYEDLKANSYFPLLEGLREAFYSPPSEGLGEASFTISPISCFSNWLFSNFGIEPFV